MEVITGVKLLLPPVQTCPCRVPVSVLQGSTLERSIGARLVPPAGSCCWRLLRNPTAFWLHYCPECQPAFAHTEWALAHAALGRIKKEVCAHPNVCIKLVCPHSFSLPRHSCWTLSSGGLSGGLDDRILHVCVSKGICDLRTHLMKCFFFLTVLMK